MGAKAGRPFSSAERWLGIAVIGLVVLAGCGGGNSSAALESSEGATPTAGGSVEEPLRLTLGVTGGTFYATEPYLIDAIGRASSGLLTVIEPDKWDITATDHDVEMKIIQAVADGNLDLGLVGTRALTSMGVNDFDALIAPMLIDSYALEQAVLDSDMPAEMLNGLDPLGVKGLALIGGDLRYPSGVDTPFLGPATFAGKTFHVFASELGIESIKALGADETDVVPQQRDVGLSDGSIDGFENAMAFSAGKPAFARHVTVNVPLWPSTGVLVASPAMLEALDQQQTEWLMDAVADTEAHALEQLTPEQESVQSVCEQGGSVEIASADDLAALGEAFQPVYEQLEADASTAAFIARIMDLKASIQPRPFEIPDACSHPGAGSDPRLPDGTYRTAELTSDDTAAALEARGIDQDIIDGFLTSPFAGQTFVMTLKLDGGSFVQLEGSGGHDDVGSSGTYRVVDDSHLELTEPCCGTSTYIFNLSGDTLTIRVDMTNEGIQEMCSSQPFDCVAWLRVYESGSFVLESDGSG
jgi:TRAP-type C4-dicarboxylate transport system substrate-binding protein